MAHHAGFARAGGTALVSPEQELVYWRELALAYQRELQALRERVLQFLDSPSPNVFASDVDAHAGWLAEVDRIERTGALETTDVVSALDDLWSRVGRP